MVCFITPVDLEGSSSHISDKGHLKQSLPLILYNICFKVNNDNTCFKDISVIRREKTYRLTYEKHIYLSLHEEYNIQCFLKLTDFIIFAALFSAFISFILLLKLETSLYSALRSDLQTLTPSKSSPRLKYSPLFNCSRTAFQELIES